MKTALLALMLLSSVGLFAQAVSGAESLSVNDGLSQGMIFDMLQGRDGFLWIATKDGLNRYDGYRYDVYAHDPFDPFSIASNEIWQIIEDSRGRLWLSYPGGIEVFLPKVQRFFQLNTRQMPGYVGESSVWAEAPDGSMWFVDESNLWRIEEPTAAIEKAMKAGNGQLELTAQQVKWSPEPLRFISVYCDSGGRLLTTTAQGLYRIEAEKRQLQFLDFPGTPLGILGEDRKGRLWLWEVQLPKDPTAAVALDLENPGGDFWLWQNPGAPKHRVPRPVPAFKYGKFDQDGNLWLLTQNTLRRWQLETLAAGGPPDFEWTCTAPFVNSSEFFYPVLCIDRSGIAWLGTNGYGILKINPYRTKFTAYYPLTSQRAFQEDTQGNLLSVVFPAVMYPSGHYDHAVPNAWRAPLGNKKATNLACVFDAAGNFWVNGKNDSLYRIDARTKAARIFLHQGFGLICNKNGQLLSVSAQGLVAFDPATETRHIYPFDRAQRMPPTEFFKHLLYEDAAGAIWIFMFKGLIKAVPEASGYHYTYFQNNPADRNTLSNDDVLCVADDPLDPAHFLWAGTKGGGLNRLDKQTGKAIHFKTAQGLPDNVVYGILPDGQGHIWLSTNRGLCRFHVREHRVMNFTAADGLPSNEFNQGSYLKLKNGRMVFGGVNGLTIFHPDSLPFKTGAPMTRIVGLKVNNETVVLRDQEYIDLSYRENFVGIAFAALEFSHPAQNRYRYRLIRQLLLGSDTGTPWVELGEKNSVQFANLPPGHYHFEVLGSNSDGVWSRQPARLYFIIHPPWWMRWWAYLLYAAALGALGLLFYRYRLRQNLARQEAIRLRELDVFKSRFFTNITHEFRTPLTVILGASQQVEERVGGDLKGQIKLIRRNGENLLRLINQLLDLSKLESSVLKINYVHGDVLQYLRYIAESLHSLAKAQNVLLRVESEEASIAMDYDPERLLQIAHNLLSNAIKFTPAGGRVSLHVSTTAAGSAAQPQLLMTVTDTGTGIPADSLPYVFDRFYQVNNLEKAKAGGTGIGLALTKELIQAMGGTIAVESEVGKGTRFTVQLPLLAAGERRSGQIPASVSRVEDLPLAPGISEAGKLPEAPAGTEDGVRLLLIEDNPDVVEYLTMCLRNGNVEGGGYDLDFAYNGVAGIEKAFETVPDLIVSDVMMPGKDGFEVVETLKHDERSSHIPIVLLTAKATVEDRIAGLRRGADAYLQKPFHAEELLVTIANLLESRRKLQQKYAGSLLLNPEETPVASPDAEDAFLRKVKNTILDHMADAQFGVSELCRLLAMSRSQLYRKLVALTDLSPVQLIRNLRLQQARALLEAGEMNVAEVAFAVGFEDPKYFSRVFAEAFGVPPSKV